MCVRCNTPSDSSNSSNHGQTEKIKRSKLTIILHCTSTGQNSHNETTTTSAPEALNNTYAKSK